MDNYNFGAGFASKNACFSGKDGHNAKVYM